LWQIHDNYDVWMWSLAVTAGGGGGGGDDDDDALMNGGSLSSLVFSDTSVCDEVFL